MIGRDRVGEMAAAEAEAGWREAIAMPVRTRVQEVLSGAADFPEAASNTLLGASPDGTLAWYLGQLLLAALLAAIAGAVAFGVLRWGRARLLSGFPAEPVTLAERIGYLLARGILQIVAVGIFYALSLVLVLALTEHPAARAVGEILTAVLTAVWAARVVFRAILAPDAPLHRVVHLGDRDARGLHRAITVITALALSMVGVCHLMQVLALPLDAHLLSLITSTLIGAILLGLGAYRYRGAVAGMILGPEPAAASALLRTIARVWHVIAIGYFLAAWAVSAVRLLLGMPAALGLVAGPVAVLLLALGLYGVLLLAIDRVAARRPVRVPEEDAGGEGAASPVSAVGGGLRELAEHAAAIVVWLVALGAILGLWGVDLSPEGWVARAADVLIVAFLGYLGYQAVKITIDRRIVDEGVPVIGEPGDEGGAGGASRLATLLPLFRNFLLVTLVAITGMIMLSQLGIDIAPLFAGAGIVGIAIGFGAQTLVRDIFSGAFFLIDDAFRVGEYLDIDGTRGTVERISVRSMQLRHHLGALHTIPFGEIKQLTNHSRDWAMMKLELRLTYDTDPERVRKLVKNLGQELLEHPEVGDKFLQPLKSQGVFRMEDSAMIVRVKYMTRPGDQFVIRKLIFSRIREVFEREGIHFAHREVTVRVAGADEPQRTAAAGGAALRAVDGSSGSDPMM